MSDEDETGRLWEQALAAFQAESWQEAADQFTQLSSAPGIDAHTSSHELSWNIGVCYSHLGQTEQAVEHFHAGGYGESDYQHLLGHDEHEAARHTWEQALAAFQAENWQEAADQFAELSLSPAIDAHTTIHELNWNMGVCYVHLGQRDLAIQHFQAGGYSESDYQTVFGHADHDAARQTWEQALAAFQAEQWEQAADLFADLSLSPGVDAHTTIHELNWNMGVCFAHLGQTDLAVQHFQAGGYSESDYHETLERITAAAH